jgi:hypothetical protein
MLKCRILKGGINLFQTTLSTTFPPTQSMVARKVRNQVYWANNGFTFPFKRRASTNFGCMLSDQPKAKGDIEVTIHDSHYRSCLLGREFFQDKQGRLYRDVDLKGTGNLDYDLEQDKLVLRHLGDAGGRRFRVAGPWGLVDQGHALTDRDFSERFSRIGARTHRVMTIIKLLELYSKDRVVSLAEALESGLIKPGEIPVITMRAYGTKQRIENIMDCANPDVGRFHIQDAKQLMAKEFNLPPLTDNGYVKLFTQELAKSLGPIHGAGYAHCCISSHNIALDARLVDLDDARTIKECNGKFAQRAQNDREQAFTQVINLTLTVKDLNSVPGKVLRIKDLFYNTYYEHLGV